MLIYIVLYNIIHFFNIMCRCMVCLQDKTLSVYTFTSWKMSLACRWPRMCFPLGILGSPRHGLICFNLPQHEVRRPGEVNGCTMAHHGVDEVPEMFFFDYVIFGPPFFWYCKRNVHGSTCIMKWVGAENRNAALHWSSHHDSCNPGKVRLVPVVLRNVLHLEGMFGVHGLGDIPLWEVWNLPIRLQSVFFRQGRHTNFPDDLHWLQLLILPLQSPI